MTTLKLLKESPKIKLQKVKPYVPEKGLHPKGTELTITDKDSNGKYKGEYPATYVRPSASKNHHQVMTKNGIESIHSDNIQTRQY